VSGVRGRTTEGRGQKSEDRRQRSEERGNRPVSSIQYPAPSIQDQSDSTATGALKLWNSCSKMIFTNTYMDVEEFEIYKRL